MCNIMNVGPPSPPLFLVVGHNTGQNIGTKIWQIRFQFDPTLITCNVVQAIYIVAFTTMKS